jgi:hypothetical protein
MLNQISRQVMPDQAANFTQQVTRLHKSVATGTDSLAQARTVEQLVTAMIPKISAHRFSGDDVKAILLGLVDDGLAGQYTDYQGAEQAVMAVQSVAEFMGRNKLLRTQAVRPAMKRLLTVVARDEKYQPAAFEQALRELKAGIQTGANK